MKIQIKFPALFSGLLLLNNVAIQAGQANSSSWKGYVIGAAAVASAALAGHYIAK